MCIDIGLDSSMLAASCHGLRGNQGFMFTDDHQMRSGKYCLTALFNGIVQKVYCFDKNDDINEQYWTYNKEVRQLWRFVHLIKTKKQKNKNQFHF